LITSLPVSVVRGSCAWCVCVAFKSLDAKW